MQAKIKSSHVALARAWRYAGFRALRKARYSRGRDGRIRFARGLAQTTERWAFVARA